MATVLLTMAIALPCSAAEFTYVNDLLAKHVQRLDNVLRTAFYNFIWFNADGNPISCLMDWMNHIPECKPTFDHDPDSQWSALVAALKAYSFLPPPPSMLFPKHHWRDYPWALHDHIMEILIPAPATATATPQQMSSVQMAPIVAQSAPQTVGGQLLQTVPMDVQQQQPSTSTAQLNRHSQPIQKHARYEHSVKHKTQQQEEVEYHRAHKARTMNELHTKRTPLPCTSPTDRRKTPSARTTKCCEQQAKQRAKSKECKTASQASLST
uniref:Uncharacterized protein n=1 Tax=Romanomermis culicivorax TaxID=13658 RepID=A0A915JZK7_ROMCU